MKDKIKKIFGDVMKSGEDEDRVAIKEEVFCTDQSKKKNRHKNSNRKSSTWNGNRNRDGASSSRDNVENDTAQNKPKCFFCGSTQHKIFNCPEKKKQQQEEVHIVLLAGNPGERQKTLLSESFGKGVLDSACSRTVCGKKWMKEYLKTLQKKQLKEIKNYSDRHSYRFGDGVSVKAFARKRIPIVIGNVKYDLKVDVVKNEIPLLISSSSLKKLKAILDFSNDVILVGKDRKRIPLHYTSTGHYCMPISRFDLDTQNSLTSIVLHTENLANMNRRTKLQKARKLHTQFAHPPKEKLIKLLKDSKDYDDKEFTDCISKVSEECTTCLEYKHQPLRPVVTLPISSKFNEVVCMDLKEFIHNKCWILHMIDSKTRYSAATLVSNKKSATIIKAVYRIWISYFGSPSGKFLSDNGGEFNNEQYREMNEKLNVESITTAAESPFSNGIVERHNLVLIEAMNKTIKSEKCEPSVLGLGNFC